MVAGKRFRSASGYPALPWGCGPLFTIDPKSPRWLVLADAQCAPTSTGAMVTDATVVADGSLNDAIRYLHQNGASGMPYLGRRRRSGDYAVVTVGALGDVEAGAHATVAGGELSHLVLQAGATAAVGRAGSVETNEFSRIVTGDLAKVKAGRFSAVAAGTEANVEVGDGAYVVAGTGARCKVGVAGRVLVNAGGELDLAERAIGVGRSNTRFRGKVGAIFVATDVVVGEATRVLTAKVGTEVDVGQWYQVDGDHFAKAAP